MTKTAFALLLALPCSAWAGGLDARAANEVKQLIEFVSASPCSFNRNGSWHPASEAAWHLSRKYQAALNRGLARSAEDFINQAATRSSLSGTPYKVRCAGGPPIGCADWLAAELRRLRGTP